MDKEKTIEITNIGDVTIVSFNSASISGADGIEEIISRLREFVTDNRPRKMVVDFGGVKFFSSQLLGLLVDVWRRLKDYDGRLVISGINPQLGRVFKITNLDRIFEFYPDRQSAVKAINADKS